MELKWSWLPLVLAAVVLVWLVIWFFPSPLRKTPRNAVLVAHAQRLRRIPRFRRLARRRQVEMLVRVVAVLFLLAGTTLLASRLTLTETHEPEVKNRDIMLCLDVSGTMRAYDEPLVREFAEIAKGLSGERIGLTIWDEVAVTVFPLTDDYDFVVEQLEEAAQAFASSDYKYLAGVITRARGQSLISDGLFSCVDRFDRDDEDRGRAIVLASDNQPNGKPIFTLDEAFDHAVGDDIVVHGLGTPDMSYDQESEKEFRSAVENTGGTFNIMGDDEATDEIARSINELEEARSKEPARITVIDKPGLGSGLVAAGVLLVVVAGLRRNP